MRLFETIDEYVLDNFFQKIADASYIRFGWTCFRLSIIALWCTVITWGVLAILYYYQTSSNIISNIMIVGFGLGSFWLLLDLRELERRDLAAQKLTAQSQMNPERLRGRIYRPVLLLMLYVSIPFGVAETVYLDRYRGAWMVLWLSSASTYYYFAACTPKPGRPAPQKGISNLHSTRA